MDEEYDDLLDYGGSEEDEAEEKSPSESKSDELEISEDPQGENGKSQETSQEVKQSEHEPKQSSKSSHTSANAPLERDRNRRSRVDGHHGRAMNAPVSRKRSFDRITDGKNRFDSRDSDSYKRHRDEGRGNGRNFNQGWGNWNQATQQGRHYTDQGRYTPSHGYRREVLRNPGPFGRNFPRGYYDHTSTNFRGAPSQQGHPSMSQRRLDGQNTNYRASPIQVGKGGKHESIAMNAPSSKPKGNNVSMRKSTGWGNFTTPGSQPKPMNAKDKEEIKDDKKNNEGNKDDENNKAKSDEFRTLLLTAIPPIYCKKGKISHYMSRYGTVSNVSLYTGADKVRKAVVLFATFASAKQAFESRDLVFNSKSIGVYRIPDVIGENFDTAEKKKIICPNRIISFKKKTSSVGTQSIQGRNTNLENKSVTVSPIQVKENKVLKAGNESTRNSLVNTLYQIPDKAEIEKSTPSVKAGNRSWSRPGIPEKRATESAVEDKDVTRARLKERIARKQKALAKHKVELCGKEIVLQKRKLTDISKRGKGKVSAQEKQDVMNQMTALLIQLKHAESAMNRANKAFLLASKNLKGALEKQELARKVSDEKNTQTEFDNSVNSNDISLVKAKVEKLNGKEISEMAATNSNGQDNLQRESKSNSETKTENENITSQRQVVPSTSVGAKEANSA